LFVVPEQEGLWNTPPDFKLTLYFSLFFLPSEVPCKPQITNSCEESAQWLQQWLEKAIAAAIEQILHWLNLKNLQHVHQTFQQDPQGKGLWGKDLWIQSVSYVQQMHRQGSNLRRKKRRLQHVKFS
jgi:hypothetical protein